MSICMTQPAVGSTVLSATDRWRYPSNTDQATPFRPVPLIDTIKVRGRVTRRALEALPVQRRASSEGRSSSQAAEVDLRPGVVLRVDDFRGDLEAGIEFSVPRLSRGANDRGETLQRAHELTAQLYEEAAGHVDWMCEPDQLELMRVDLVRDFRVPAESARPHLTALAMVPGRRARTETYSSIGSSLVKTLYRKTDRWQARLYDRTGRSSEAKSDDVTVRYELQLNSRFLKAERLRVMSDLHDASSGRLLLHYFERCRFGVGVGPALEKCAQALATGEHTSLSRRGLLGQWASDALDERSGTPSDDSRTAVKYRRKAEALGLVPSDLYSDSGRLDAHVQRLDYASGLLVA